jgi:S1/P1 Nuclease
VYYFPGFAPYAAMEQYYKLVASFRMVRILERLSGDDTMRLAELGQARANAVHTMGVLSHWIGDMAQPLHTTIHHHGWIGENPEGFSTESSIHSYIDSGVIKKHSLEYTQLRTMVAVSLPCEPSDDVWMAVKEHLARSHGELEELYRMERDGALGKPEGKRFIVNRLADGGQTLAGLYLAAWEASALDDDDVANYLRYEPSSKQSP